MMASTKLPVAVHRLVRVGLCGALVFLGGFGTYLSLETPAYEYPDEQVHVGYLLSLREATLPTIDTPIPVEADADAQLRERLAKEAAGSHRTEIYAANNPPFVYLVGLPFAELGSWFGAPSPAPLSLRLLGVAAGMGTVVVTYLLARELSGGDAVVGLAAAGVVSATIGLVLVGSLALLDSAALLATTGLSWAVARSARSAAPREVLHVGVWAALAAAVRPMSAVLAGVAVLVAMVFVWRSGGGAGWGVRCFASGVRLWC